MESMGNITVHIDDRSQEVLEALRNAIERGAMAIGEKAVSHAKHNLMEQNAVNTGRLRNSLTYMVKEE